MRARAAALAGFALAAAACRGPRPTVVSSSLRPAPGGESYVEVVVENAGGGEGEVRVEATLHADDRAIERATREVTLRAHERVRVLLPVPVAADGGYRLEVTARYPVD